MVEEYTYLSKENDRELESFSIEKDFEYYIPLLKEALTINPNLKFISAPWSAPADFKTRDPRTAHHKLRKDFGALDQRTKRFVDPKFKTSDSLYGGGMKDDWLEPYSRYLAKYIKAYKG